MGMTVYINNASISKSGNIAKMLIMINFQAPQIRPQYRFRSQAEGSEYDCRQLKTRLLGFTRFSDQMGEGETVFSDRTTSDWKEVVPGSAGEVLFELACGMQSLPKFK